MTNEPICSKINNEHKWKEISPYASLLENPPTYIDKAEICEKCGIVRVLYKTIIENWKYFSADEFRME